MLQAAALSLGGVMTKRASRLILRNAIIVMVCLLVGGRSNGWGATGKSSEPINVGMLALLAAPQKYNGKIIRTIGYLYLRSDSDALFFHQEDLEIPILKDSFSLELTLEQKQQFKGLSLTYVMVQGVMRSSGADGRGLNSGTITHITMVHGWKPYVPFDSNTK
jgi:hypothetical protein